MDNIVQDRSGTLVSGVFYRFETFDDDSPPLIYTKTPGILSPRSPTPDELFIKKQEPWMHVVHAESQRGELEVQRRCPLDKMHVTEQYRTKTTFHLIRGSRISDFLPDESLEEGQHVVSETFAERLNASGLTGFRLEPIVVGVNKTSAKDVKLWSLHSRGRSCERPWKVVGAPNSCPYCGRAPIFCPGCGDAETICPKCKKLGLATRKDHQGAKDPRLIIAPPQDLFPRVVDGMRWDGSDFSYARSPSDPQSFITKRALDWLLSIHAAPFYAEPTPVNIDGMTKEQLAQLEAAKRPITQPSIDK